MKKNVVLLLVFSKPISLNLYTNSYDTFRQLKPIAYNQSPNNNFGFGDTFTLTF
ncbi:MAG: hypothetical protein RR357_01870 [Clostridia bacterium]